MSTRSSRRQHAQSSTLTAAPLSPPSSRSPSPTLLRKGATFHAPDTPAAECSHLVTPPPSLARAKTCPKALDDIVASREKRMAAYLSSFDSGSLSSQKEALDELPLPRAVIDTAMDPFHHQPDPRHRQHSRRQHFPAPARHDHASDSGLGSSVTGSNRTESHAAEILASFTAINNPRTRSGRVASGPTFTPRGPSAITRSHSALNPTTQPKSLHILTSDARQQIRKRILQPILSRNFLKDFHPLLRDIPRRIESKDISCLRDLEKTLLLLAPERAKSPDLYLNFCETSIQCIQATVNHLGELDQRRPADRPYTEGYFLDLVQQVRHYAGIMAASRERDGSGRATGDNDYHPSERLVLHGGLTENGQPAELVRYRDGKKISLSTGAQVVDDPKTGGIKPPKRSSSHLTAAAADDDAVHRSMGPRRRRRVSDEGPVLRVCKECNKEFQRNCDLTKHEKTHTRPWKCSEVTCEFHTRGWPTEKERDRHFSDKHMDGPKFHCEFAGCDYASKRESNCKQHMEKSHGWTYIRSKNNGKKGSGATPSRAAVSKQKARASRKSIASSSSASPMSAEVTPQTPSIPTPASPLTPMSNSPYEGVMSNPYAAVTGTVASDYDDIFEDPLSDFPMTEAPAFGAFQGPVDDFDHLTFPDPATDAAIDGMNDFYNSQVDDSYATFNVQMPTPMASTHQPALASFSAYPARSSNPNLSPIGNEDVMLYTPPTVAGSDFDEQHHAATAFNAPQMGMMHNDFSLYSSGGEGSSRAASVTHHAAMFPSLDSQGNQTTGADNVSASLDDFLAFGQNTQ